MPADPLHPAPRAFLTTYGLVLVCLAADPTARVRDLAARIGVTERAVQSAVTRLAAGGFLTVTKAGQRRRYEVRTYRPLGLPLAPGRTVADLVAFGLARGRP